MEKQLAPAAARFVDELSDELRGKSASGDRDSIADMLRKIGDGSVRSSDLINEVRAHVEDFQLFFSRDDDESQHIPLRALMATIEKRVFTEERIRHSFQYKSLMRVDEQIHKLADVQSQLGDASRAFSVNFRDDDARDKVKFDVNSCLQALGVLQRAASYIERMVEMEEILEPWANYFAAFR